MNGDTTDATRAPRKPRPEIQIYRPGALRQGGSTKNLTAGGGSTTTTNDERLPPRPEKLTSSGVIVTSSGASRRRSNDTDSVTSRGGSGSTTPDAMAMNERAAGRQRFERRTDGGGGHSNYNSTQSLYDTRQQGGYMEYNGNQRNHRNGRFQNSHQNHQNHQNPSHFQQRQPFERNSGGGGGGNYFRGFNERASMRGDGAIARRPQGSRRQRNDSINSTQSEMPPATTSQPLHIDTSLDSASQCGASSNYSMNSLGEAFSFEEMCQNLQNFASMDWSKEVEEEFAMQREMEEAAAAAKLQNPPRRRRGRGTARYDESDRESSFGGSIAEEPAEEEAEPIRSGERTPTSTRSGNVYVPRGYPQNHQKTSRGGAANDENHHHGVPKQRKEQKEPRKYRGEHDDRDDETTEYSLESHMTSGRLAGRITIVPRENVQSVAVEGTARNSAHRQHTKPDDSQRPFHQKRSQNQSEMATRAEQNRRRQEEIERNEGRKIREIGEKMEKLSGLVKKRDLKAAEKISEFSMKLANIYSKLIVQDVIYSFTAGLEQKLFRQAFYKSIECLRTGSNSASPDARLIRAATQKLLLNGIVFYESLISTYESEFHVAMNDVLTWTSGWPTDEELCDEEGLDLPIGSQKYESAVQKTAIKSLSRHLISLGDLHRYKSLIDGSENYEISKR
ncbi:hypothetical protein GCK72_011469 [Caenorhabditis remanei]|uniref:Telomerase activating protein Est1-like N-terminal domain-containing protein n=1 Tax=Caenorhabditis remanei TaxID=31234 RepID=A0A6A5H9V6_CAERE|nr:hypothetical protein GCK72_011469 [Caenorhabditis remanei]KAF1763203.1 hypothetical protein GCK72_011469 [Caenorhabditis remanei]